MKPNSLLNSTSPTTSNVVNVKNRSRSMGFPDSENLSIQPNSLLTTRLRASSYLITFERAYPDAKAFGSRADIGFWNRKSGIAPIP